MSAPERIVLVVRPSRDGARNLSLARWLRKLLPAAYLLVASAAVLPDPGPDAITLDADDDVSPLALADEIVRHLGRPPR